jgi:YggT family protein
MTFMAVVVDSLYWLIDTLLGLYIWVIIIGAILSWLVAFDVVNTRNRVVYVIGDFTYRLTEPALRPIRRVVPDLGGVDISPLLLILLLFFVRRLLAGFYASLFL